MKDIKSLKDLEAFEKKLEQEEAGKAPPASPVAAEPAATAAPAPAIAPAPAPVPASPESGQPQISGPPKIQEIEAAVTAPRRLVFKKPAGLAALFMGVVSKDHPTRRMAWVFLCSLVALIVTGVSTIKYFSRLKERSDELSAAERAKHNLTEFLRKQAEEAKFRVGLVEIGSYTIELKTAPDQKRMAGLLNIAEIELTLSCDSKDTRDFVLAHMTQVRNQVTNFLTAMDRHELLTKEGKAKFKRGLIDALNAWLPRSGSQGQVHEVFITRLIMT